MIQLSLMELASGFYLIRRCIRRTKKIEETTKASKVESNLVTVNIYIQMHGKTTSSGKSSNGK